ncbi:ABC transporter substrate-binding protein [Planotetraspora phitsanulokensis]|uniref:Peptide ABC transporter n=1 Tax=Planotetraspora phitsanulokensis TaxID=575192 RepID=A0A8J3UAF4_9ACTN|nr:ABC transporter substrate-binding protein [Planotetraspora phitsanulokensis]GII41588.1 peptide ABC transporter [Planotetraspora phitsanulokensis]
MSPSRTVRSLVATLAGLSLLTACGGGTAGTVDGGSTRPVRGGTLNLSMSLDPLCLDPHAISSDVEQIFGHILTDNLVYLDEKGDPSPWLATSWEISPDAKTYTFHLRKGVTFSDGAVFDAQAVVTNFEHMLNPATRSPLAGPYIAPYKDGKIIDDHTLEVHLSRPYVPFLTVLAQGWLGMESPKAIKESTPAQLCEHPVGSGPFVLTGYTKNQSVTFARRADYNWPPDLLKRSGPAYLDGIKVDWVGQDAVRFNSLVSGQYQATGYLPAQNAQTVKSNPNLEYHNNNRIGWPFTLDFNVSRAPFDDIDVRRAFAASVNVPAIIQTIGFGQRQPATGFLDRVTQYYDPKVKFPGYDPAKANQLLDQAGWTGRDADGYRTKDGKVLEAQLPVTQTATVSPIYNLVQAQAKAVGFKVNVNLLPLTQVTTLRYAGDYDLLSGVWHTNTPDVLYIKYATESIPNDKRLGQNLSHLSDPEIDTWLEQARQTTDSAKLKDLYGKVQQRLVDLVPGVPIYDNSVLWATSKKLQGVITDTSHATPVFTYAWLTK